MTTHTNYTSNTSLSDPALPIAALPYEVPLNDGLDTKLRIISYYAPHVQSFDLLPCLVNMMTTAFNNVYENPNPHAKLLQNQYTCSANSFGLQITGNQIMTPPLEYSDLISLARMLLLFQQTHTMPGLRFEYWLKGQMRGQGHAWMLFVQGSNGSESLGQS